MAKPLYAGPYGHEAQASCRQGTSTTVKAAGSGKSYLGEGVTGLNEIIMLCICLCVLLCTQENQLAKLTTELAERHKHEAHSVVLDFRLSLHI